MSQSGTIDISSETMLAEKLRALAHDGRELDIAQFQFVGFEKIAQAYGERWSVQKERVKEIAHTFIKRRLGADDMLVRAADGFVIVYGGDDGEAAREHAEGVKVELNGFYLGEGATQPPAQVSVSHARLPVHELLKTIGQVELVTASKKLPPDEQLANLSVKFQPAWDARKEAVMKYYAVPILRGTGERVPGYQHEIDIDIDSDRNYDHAAIDEMVLKESEIALGDMVRDGRQSLVAVSLHYSSLRKAETRIRLCNMIGKLNRDLLRYRVVHIAGAPPGCPKIYLQEIYTALKQCAPRVAFNVPWNEPDLRNILSFAPFSIGYSLSPWAMGENAAVSQHELCARMKSAAETAHAAKARLFFDGHVDATMVSRMRGVGVDVISSSVVWPVSDMPEGALRWPAGLLAA